MPEEPLEERTEEPTPRRREEARKKGQIVKSRELSSVAILGASFFTFLVLSCIFFQQIYIIFNQCLNSYYYDLNINTFLNLFNNILAETNKILLPFFILVSLVAIIVYLVQTGGGVWAYEAINFNFDRINPVEGFKRLFSLTALFELFKSLAKLAIIIGVSYWIIEKHLNNILKLFGVEIPYLAFSFKVFIKDFITKLLFILTILAVLDWLYTRWDVERKLKLTRQELKEELKQTEGDPWVRSRIRQKQREMSRRRMLAEVPKADVVITNPTHYAVALKYEIGKMPAPQVIAKGKDFLAQKIKEIALENKIPVYEDPPLARLLYEKVEIGEYIPEDLYQVVAKVLAYVYKLKNKKVV
ncbi:flagellar biosynthesis protein FlhB [Thermodesulfobacterium hydrogeniphilum]|uniref:flagellar biosynthesis protein FlhB n=1 Tax=Thermodesulfobacterium hydrogeniphilum TaxID=161156 RepID=UPI00056E489C|nr:flagellar biosynthesis protein FlhB [Thermodesulfobacterium hydrogeniphilum]